jgi:hypothetical protein
LRLSIFWLLFPTNWAHFYNIFGHTVTYIADSNEALRSSLDRGPRNSPDSISWLPEKSSVPEIKKMDLLVIYFLNNISRLGQGTLNKRERSSTADLLIQFACFVIINNVNNIKVPNLKQFFQRNQQK